MLNANFFKIFDVNALSLSSFVFYSSGCWCTYYFVSIIFILMCSKKLNKKLIVLNLIVLKNDNIVCI